MPLIDVSHTVESGVASCRIHNCWRESGNGYGDHRQRHGGKEPSLHPGMLHFRRSLKECRDHVRSLLIYGRVGKFLAQMWPVKSGCLGSVTGRIAHTQSLKILVHKK